VGLRVKIQDGGYVATVTPPHLTGTEQWESDAPMSGRDLVNALLELGCHQQDIGDAFSAVDPDWLHHLDSRPR
jgi:hypothetical protein